MENEAKQIIESLESESLAQEYKLSPFGVNE